MASVGEEDESKKEVEWKSLDSPLDPTAGDLEIKNPILAGVFHWGMIAFVLFLIFAVTGGLFWLLLNTKCPELFHAKTEWAAWGQFGLGGLLGVGAAVRRYQEPLKARWVMS